MNTLPYFRRNKFAERIVLQFNLPIKGDGLNTPSGVIDLISSYLYNNFLINFLDFVALGNRLRCKQS